MERISINIVCDYWCVMFLVFTVQFGLACNSVCANVPIMYKNASIRTLCSERKSMDNISLTYSRITNRFRCHLYIAWMHRAENHLKRNIQCYTERCYSVIIQYEMFKCFENATTDDKWTKSIALMVGLHLSSWVDNSKSSHFKYHHIRVQNYCQNKFKINAHAFNSECTTYTYNVHCDFS